jgi:MATE family multidrug resistance protein
MAQNYFYIQGIIQSVTAVFHFLWCYIFVDLLEIPLEGAAIAKSITDIISAIAILLYVRLSDLNSQIESPFWCREYTRDLLSYFKRTMSIGANLYIFWLTYGISGFIVSALNDEYIIGAHGLATTFSSVLFTMPSGNSLAMQTYLGNAVGEGSKNKAQKIVFAGFSLNTIFSLINVCILLFGNEFFANFSTSDKTTQEILKEMIFIYVFIHIPDTFGEHLCGVLRTIGKEREVVLTCICCAVVIGLSCQWIFGVVLEYSYIGIWFSLGVGIYLYCSCLAVRLYFLNWDKGIEYVKQQLKKENKQREKETWIELVESI